MEVSRTATETLGMGLLLIVNMNYYGLLWIITDYYGLLWIIMDPLIVDPLILTLGMIHFGYRDSY